MAGIPEGVSKLPQHRHYRAGSRLVSDHRMAPSGGTQQLTIQFYFCKQHHCPDSGSFDVDGSFLRKDHALCIGKQV